MNETTKYLKIEKKIKELECSLSSEWLKPKIIYSALFVSCFSIFVHILIISTGDEFADFINYIISILALTLNALILIASIYYSDNINKCSKFVSKLLSLVAAIMLIVVPTLSLFFLFLSLRGKGLLYQMKKNKDNNKKELIIKELKMEKEKSWSIIKKNKESVIHILNEKKSSLYSRLIKEMEIEKRKELQEDNREIITY